MKVVSLSHGQTDGKAVGGPATLIYVIMKGVLGIVLLCCSLTTLVKSELTTLATILNTVSV